MARRQSTPILGGFRGKIGPVVFTTIKDQDIVRSIPTKKSKRRKRKPGQEQNMQNFKSITAFLRPLSDVFKLGYQLSKKSSQSPVNAALSWHSRNAVTIKGELKQINVELLKMSHSIHPTQRLWKPEVTALSGSSVKVSWEMTPLPQSYTMPDDKVVIVCYFKNRERFFTHLDGRRDQGEWILQSPWPKEEESVFCYIFACSEDGSRVSETTFLGMIDLIN